jgi:cystathionine beta-lyase
MKQLPTELIHHPYRPPAGFEAVAPAVHKASTIVFPSLHALRNRDWRHKSGYTYGLHGTPTSFMLEQRIATLEGAKHCMLVTSGLAALTTVDMALLASGDELLIPDNAYGPNKAFAEAELKAWGITAVYYDPMQPADLAARLTARSRLVWLEVPGSITLEFPDLRALVQVVRAHADAHPKGIVTALDNTWGAGIAFAPFDLGVDISIQALTKYPSGGADVLMGSICTRDEALHHTLHLTHMRLGIGVGGNDVELVLRGLNTIALRYAAQDQATRELAVWMQDRPEVDLVLHPALPGSPGHGFWQRDCQAAACLFSVLFKPGYSAAQVDAFCEALQLFKIGYSWAGPLSLAVPYDMPSLRSLGWARQGALVRFAVGLEAVEDLKADIAQALDKM